ncbi:hypothetical protein [Prochlorococcus sp. MIT 1223]|uniref:hypothetical protein n=1 Tax=Prochlorococcus sp. MIT 1223 TaxID=3096217 RepID=UPI002A74E816|nr:hypothetical protein [Prochlorococcus sp. MIT 1223]
MILLEITNSSEVVKAKAGKILEKMTPDKIDRKLVERQVLQNMLEQLKAEGLKGEISTVKGLEIRDNNLITKNGFTIKETKKF